MSEALTRREGPYVDVDAMVAEALSLVQASRTMRAARFLPARRWRVDHCLTDPCVHRGGVVVVSGVDK